MNQIKFLDLHSYHKNIEETIIKSLQQNVFNDTSFIHGKSVTNLEKSFMLYNLKKLWYYRHIFL